MHMLHALADTFALGIMDALALSRLQFAITIFYHFLFVPLTIGLVVIVAIMETKYYRTKNPIYKQMAEFWGRLFVINFVLGVVTGITMEFQFGTNWSEYSKFMGDIFGSPLAIEALVAFFLESTFIGVWIFGRHKFSPKIRVIAMWMVAIGTNISALWIITANGFMQNPVGFQLAADGSKVLMNDFWALTTNPYAWWIFAHTMVACYICGSFFVMGVSSWHLIRKKNVAMFKKSFKYGLAMALFAVTVTPMIGHSFGNYTTKTQPAKAAAMEAIWESGVQDISVISVVNKDGERILDWITIPKIGSLMYTNSLDGEVTGLNDIAVDERPPVAPVFYSFRAMVGLGMFFLFAAWIGLYYYRKDKLLDQKWYLKMMTWSILLPYLAINLGWVVTEMGRQPWAVYGLMKTADAVSPVPSAQVWFSLISLIIFYTVLLVANVYLQLKYIRKGPDPIPANELAAWNGGGK